MPRTATPMLRMSWTAYSKTAATQSMLNLADQLRGARIEAPLHPNWMPFWTVWQGQSEMQPSRNSMRYGVTLWLELCPDVGTSGA